MASIELNNKQLRIIQSALDLYNRVGILQLDRITDHPNIDEMLIEQFMSDTDLVIGSETGRGTIVEIGNGYIKTKGTWGNGEEIKKWTDIENIHNAIDYTSYHKTKDKIASLNSEIKKLITGEDDMARRGTSFSLGKGKDDYLVYDMIQSIRHKFWEADPERSSVTVDSSITKMSHEKMIKVEIDNE